MSLIDQLTVIRRTALQCAFVMFAFVSTGLAVGQDPVVQTKPATEGTTLVFSDDFDRDQLGAKLKSPFPDFRIEDGLLKGRQIKPNHGGTLHSVLNRPNGNAIVELKFRFEGGRSFSLACDDRSFKGSHAGHIARIVVRTDVVRMFDDKLGLMRHDIRKLLKSGDKEQIERGKIMAADATRDIPVHLQHHQWYSLKLTIIDDVMSLAIDGKQIGKLKSDGLAHPTKPDLGMSAWGEDESQEVHFDDLRVYSVQSNGPDNATERSNPIAPQWQEVELQFESNADYANPYLEADAWVDFTHDKTGATIRRPMFWDGGKTFRVRFASTQDSGVWKWTSSVRDTDERLAGKSGTLTAMPHSSAKTIFGRHGFWKIPSGGRNLIHADGTARLLCADTAWALPYRATPDQVKVYANDRREKGFNAALLMTVQPDMRTTGPRSRREDLGFDVGFEDLPQGTLRELNADYFQRFDELVDVLIEHGIAPVYQPVFHGYGWKGGETAGNVVSAEDYARYCRYLVARYGARPAIWLIGGDGTYTTEAIVEQLDAAGEAIEASDAYQQPTGIHYAPHALNRTHQAKRWLDFQWCQTGHNGEHKAERVADMWRNTPIKAVANGEPTYENMRRRGVASGWWQGHEAWCNLMAGGTMGVVYGAGSLWQWRLHAEEPGHAAWCSAEDAGWREALDFEGSKYPGVAAKIFDGLPLAGMQPNWTCTYGQRGLLVPKKLFVVYLPEGRSTTIISADVPRSYRIFDPMTGAVVDKGELADKPTASVNTNSDEPRVIVFVAETQ